MDVAKFREWYQSIVKDHNWIDNFLTLMNSIRNDPDVGQFLEVLQQDAPQVFTKVYEPWLIDEVSTGRLGNNDAYADLGTRQWSPTEETSKYLDNRIAQENTAADREYQTQMRDTSLTSAASQLSSLGLSTSNVIQTGGAASGVSSEAAKTSTMASGIGRKQQLAMNQYNQRMSMAKSLISMAGSMASSGIYGASLNAAKHSAAALAAAASHSGLSVMKHYNGYGNSTFPVDENGLLKI